MSLATDKFQAIIPNSRLYSKNGGYKTVDFIGFNTHTPMSSTENLRLLRHKFSI